MRGKKQKQKKAFKRRRRKNDRKYVSTKYLKSGVVMEGLPDTDGMDRKVTPAIPNRGESG
jgi:hypothetical protein